MKQNKILYSAILLISAMITLSCSDSFLDVKPKGQVLESSYYSSPDEALAGLIAAYGPINIEAQNTYCSPLGPANSASDDCYCGGGGASDMNQWQAMNDMNQLTSAVMPIDMWNVNFQGVNYSNLILSKLEGVPGLSDADKARYTAEGKFLRAYYYFHLLRWFKNVPLFTEPQTSDDLYSATQADPKDVYAQIEKDFTEAIPDLPATVPASENGRATQGAAKAWLGKVYLYEQKWTEAANVLKDVNGTPGGNSQYGYSLMANYGDIFSPSYKFNSEAVFEIQKISTQNYDWGGWGNYKSNVYSIMIGPRAYVQNNPSAPNYLSGWSFNPITPDLHDAMIVNGNYDPRYPYTITNLDSLVTEGLCAYDKSQCYAATGYFMVKFAPLQQYTSATGVKELNFGIDYIEVRLADTYLMEAEALVMGGGDNSRAQALLDAVRSRVGLPSVPVTMDAIKYERRMELATEGHRFFDLVRWGDADRVLNHMQNGFSKHFVVGKNEILPIPLAELTNTQMKQNTGY
ncbi:MAG: RagB/SusD family nutrient uptake outer membrane protein [Candidatus Azobacteroides sp.]|nr:RagB/SusD family nutrient uptake outer membrane protein [Candidatus Azobacteroides sp.]